MAIDPRWPRASDWLAGAHLPAARATLGVVGLPVGLGAVTPGHCELAPKAIRKRLTRLSTADLAADLDLRELIARDHGDAPLATLPLAQLLEPARAAVRAALDGSVAALVLGGHDAITRPACRALGARPRIPARPEPERAGQARGGPTTSTSSEVDEEVRRSDRPAQPGEAGWKSLDRLPGDDLRRVGLLTLDAHFDLRDLEGGLSNGNPVRALLADGLPGENVVQLGLQSYANSLDYAAVARAAGSTWRTVEQLRERGVAATVVEFLRELSARVDAIYVDIDLDVLDRCHVPGAPGARPGGLAPHELFEAVVACGRERKVRALGLVEVDPEKDVADLSTFAAARCALSFASGVLQRVRAGSAAPPPHASPPTPLA